MPDGDAIETTTATGGYTNGTRSRKNVQVAPAPGAGKGDEESRTMAWASLPANVKSILDKYDTNKDGTFSVSEVINISDDLIREKTEKKKYGRIIIILAVVMLMMLAANAALTAGIVFLAKDSEVDSSGKMKVKGTNLVISTAGNAEPAPLSSYLPDLAFDELKAFTATSESGARVHVNVLGWMRLPAAECLPPIVKLNTQAGAIHIEGETLEFSQDVAPIFLEAGFLTGSHVTATGVGDTRRKLSMAALTGFFNQLDNVKADNTTTCIPTVPTMPSSLHAVSKKLDKCLKCHDENGFLIPNLGGVEMMNGVLYRAVDEAATRVPAIPGPDVNVSNAMPKERTVTRYPRYPELTQHHVMNGSHAMSWVEYKNEKYHCSLGYGFSVPEEESDDGATHKPSDAPPPKERTVEELEAKGMVPKVRYDGFTWYVSRGRGGDPIPTLKFEITMLGGKVKIDLFTTVKDVNQFLGIQYRDWNAETYRWEMKQHADYTTVYKDEQIPQSISDPSRFELPDPMSCVRKNAAINMPPRPRDQPVGPGIIMSPSGVDEWGLPRDGPLPGIEVNEDIDFFEEPSDEDIEAMVANGSHRALNDKARIWVRGGTEQDAVNRRELGAAGSSRRRANNWRRRSGSSTRRRRCSDCEIEITPGSCTTVAITAGPIELEIDPCGPKITGTATGSYGLLEVSGSLSVDFNYHPPDVEGCISMSLGCSSVLGLFIPNYADDICDALGIPDLVTGEGCLSSTHQSVWGCIYPLPIPVSTKAASLHFDLCLSVGITINVPGTGACVWGLCTPPVEIASLTGEACARYVELYDYTNKKMGSFIRVDYDVGYNLAGIISGDHSDGIYPSSESQSCSSKRWSIHKTCPSGNDCSAAKYYQWLNGDIGDPNGGLNPNPTGRTYAGNKGRNRKGRARLRE